MSASYPHTGSSDATATTQGLQAHHQASPTGAQALAQPAAAHAPAAVPRELGATTAAAASPRAGTPGAGASAVAERVEGVVAGASDSAAGGVSVGMGARVSASTGGSDAVAAAAASPERAPVSSSASGAAPPKASSGAASPKASSGAASPKASSGAASPKASSGGDAARVSVPPSPHGSGDSDATPGVVPAARPAADSDVDMGSGVASSGTGAGSSTSVGAKHPQVDDYKPSFSNDAVHCYVCKTDITAAARIQCAVCRGVDLCPQCAVLDTDAGEHRRSHAYRVMDNLGVPVDAAYPDWTADEELRMLEGIQLFGFGNWKEIADHIGTKSAAKVRQHYVEKHLGGRQPGVLSPVRGAASTPSAANDESGTGAGPAPVPPHATTSGSPVASAQGADEDSDVPMAAAEEHGTNGGGIDAVDVSVLDSVTNGHPPAAVDGAMEHGTALAGESVQSPSAKRLRSSKSQARGDANGHRGAGDGTGGTGDATPAVAGEVALPTNYNIAGYLPLRQDFDVEHDNEAELILADMEFNDEDNPAETELKLKILEMYNGKLEERKRRKAFVFERDLLNFKKQQAIERRRSREEREVYSLLRPFARFQSPEEHEELAKGIILEQQLRKRVAELQAYRRNGLRSLAQIEEYEAARRQREMDDARKKQRASVPYLNESRQRAVTSRDRSSRYRQRGQKRGRGGAALRRSPTSPRDASPHPTYAADTGADGGTSPRAHVDLLARGDAAPGKRVSSAPLATRLDEREQRLCEALRLLPSQYMAIKSALVNESVARGFVTRNAAQQLVRSEAAEAGAAAGAVYDLCVQCGWVNIAPAEGLAPALTAPPSTTMVDLPRTQPSEVAANGNGQPAAALAPAPA